MNIHCFCDPRVVFEESFRSSLHLEPFYGTSEWTHSVESSQNTADTPSAAMEQDVAILAVGLPSAELNEISWH